MVLPIFEGVRPSAPLKNSDGTTFDPLGVATILPNPRATGSAIRLYTQYPRSSFRWPHLMQIGGTLTPLGVFVEHFLSHNRSTHPALSMVLQTAEKLPVRSTTVFKDLPLDFSNLWIADACNFAPSANANNDFLVVNVDRDEDSEEQIRKDLTWVQHSVEIFFTMFGIFIGLVLLAEMILSVLLVDIWAAVLFLIYLSHWLASTLISFTYMVGPRPPAAAIVKDGTPSFAVYERKGGGTIVFKGRKDTFEKWFRQTWQFNEGPWNETVHWMWILTGTAAAIGSTAAMVNMRASLQLGFLGVLVACSLAELLITRLIRRMEMKPHLPLIQLFDGNEYRTEGIVRTVLEARAGCKLDGLDWISLGLLPDIPAFKEMLVMLDRLDRVRGVADEATIDEIIEQYKSAAGAEPAGLIGRIGRETRKCAMLHIKEQDVTTEKPMMTVSEVFG